MLAIMCATLILRTLDGYCRSSDKSEAFLERVQTERVLCDGHQPQLSARHMKADAPFGRKMSRSLTENPPRVSLLYNAS